MSQNERLLTRALPQTSWAGEGKLTPTPKGTVCLRHQPPLSKEKQFLWLLREKLLLKENAILSEPDVCLCVYTGRMHTQLWCMLKCQWFEEKR